jgi:hypothetical protein
MEKIKDLRMENKEIAEEVYYFIGKAIRASACVRKNVLVDSITNSLVSKYGDNLERETKRLKMETTKDINNWIDNYLEKVYPNKVDEKKKIPKVTKNILETIIDREKTWEPNVICEKVEEYPDDKEREYRRLTLGFNTTERITDLLYLYAYESDKKASAKSIYSFLL